MIVEEHEQQIPSIEEMEVDSRTKEHNPTAEKNPIQKLFLGAPQQMTEEDDEHTKLDDPREHDAKAQQPITKPT